MRIIIALFLLASVSPLGAQLEIRNQYWFRDQATERPIWLFGHGITNLISCNQIDIAEHNKHYASAGANTLRLHLTQGALGEGAPWALTDDGRYDLERWNEHWWNRLREYMDDCRERGIFPFVQIWDEPVIERGATRWRVHPWRPSNNVNALTGIDDDPGGHGMPGMYDAGNEKLMALQDKFVRRVLDVTAPYGLCIYSICNEYDFGGKAPLEWQQHWIDFFKSYEESHPGLPAPLLLTNTAVKKIMLDGKDSFPLIDWFYLGRDFRMKSYGNAGKDQSGTGAAQLRSMIERARELFPGILLLNSRPGSSPDRGVKDYTNEAETRRIAWTFFTSAVHLAGFRHLNPAGPDDTAPWLRTDPKCVECTDGLAMERALTSVRNFIMLARPDLDSMVPSYDEKGGSPAFRIADERQQVIYLPEGGRAYALVSSCCDEVYRYYPDDPGAGLELMDRTFGSDGWQVAGDRETVFFITQ